MRPVIDQQFNAKKICFGWNETQLYEIQRVCNGQSSKIVCDGFEIKHSKRPLSRKRQLYSQTVLPTAHQNYTFETTC